MHAEAMDCAATQRGLVGEKWDLEMQKWEYIGMNDSENHKSPCSLETSGQTDAFQR